MKTDNQMEPCFRKAVETMDRDIAGLLDDARNLVQAREAIVKLYGGETEFPPVPVIPAPVPGEVKVVQTRGRRSQTAATGKPKTGGASEAGAGAAGLRAAGRQPSAETVKLMAAARTAPEPFTAESLRVASGLEVKFIVGRLYAWKAAGWIVPVASGQYERTKSFPPAATE